MRYATYIIAFAIGLILVSSPAMADETLETIPNSGSGVSGTAFDPIDGRASDGEVITSSQYFAGESGEEIAKPKPPPNMHADGSTWNIGTAFNAVINHINEILDEILSGGNE